MLTIQVNAPEAGALVKNAENALAVVQAISIDSPEMYDAAATELRSIKQRIDALDEQRTKLVKPLNDTVRNINDLFRKPLGLLTEASSALRQTMLTYQDEQERIRRDEEARARIAAEAEQKRLRDEALTRERAAAEESGRLQALAATSTSREQAVVLEQQAVEVQQQGAADAAALIETAAIVTSAPVATAAPKAAGISTRGTKKARLVSKAALIAHVAAHPDLLDLLDVNEPKLNQMARALGSNLKIPGVEVYEERTLSARRAVA